MKTIKTALGFKKIEGGDSALVFIELKSILEQHRATLIDKLIAGGLESYVRYRFDRKLHPKEVGMVKDNLVGLRDSPLEVKFYQSIFDTVQRNDFIALGNALFYEEIDKHLKTDLFRTDLFSSSKTQSTLVE